MPFDYQQKKRETSPLRVLPSDQDAERGLLGALMLDNPLIASAGSLDRLFYLPRHELIHGATLDLYLSGEIVYTSPSLEEV